MGREERELGGGRAASRIGVMDGQVRGVLISKFYSILTYLLPAALGTKILASVLFFYKRRVEALFSKYKRGVRVPPLSDEYLRAVVLEAPPKMRLFFLHLSQDAPKS